MRSYLRNIALTVGNTGSDENPHFFWSLMESSGGANDFPIQFEAAPMDGYGTYGEALVAGYEAWRRLVGDHMKDGPRVRIEDAP